MTVPADLKASFAASMAQWMSEPSEETPTAWVELETSGALPSAADLAPGGYTAGAVDEAMIKLALSGRVLCTDLVTAAPSEMILNSLAEYTVVDGQTGQVRWMLKHPKRLEVVRALMVTGQLADKLAQPLPRNRPVWPLSARGAARRSGGTYPARLAGRPAGVDGGTGSNQTAWFTPARLDDDPASDRFQQLPGRSTTTPQQRLCGPSRRTG